MSIATSGVLSLKRSEMKKGEFTLSTLTLGAELTVEASNTCKWRTKQSVSMRM